MTRREVISRLRGDLVEHFDDSTLYNRQLWGAFWSATLVLLQREADGNKLTNQNIFKPYNLDTEEVNQFENSCVPLECIACQATIPEVVMSKTGPIHSFLGSPDMSLRYDIVNPTEFVVKSKIKGNRTRYALYEGNKLKLSHCIPCLLLLAVPGANGQAPPTGKCSVMDLEVGMPSYLVEGAIGI